MATHYAHEGQYMYGGERDYTAVGTVKCALDLERCANGCKNAKSERGNLLLMVMRCDSGVMSGVRAVASVVSRYRCSPRFSCI